MYLPNQINDVIENRDAFTRDMLHNHSQQLFSQNKISEPSLSFAQYIQNHSKHTKDVNYRSSVEYNAPIQEIKSTQDMVQTVFKLGAAKSEHISSRYCEINILGTPSQGNICEVEEFPDKTSSKESHLEIRKQTLPKLIKNNSPQKVTLVSQLHTGPRQVNTLQTINTSHDNIRHAIEMNKINSQILSKLDENEHIKEGVEEEKKDDEENYEEACRICLESEQTSELGKMIVPCRCMGSMKWVHDECLKTWIVSKEKNIKKAYCELCMTTFNMSFAYKTKFYPKTALKDGRSSFFSCLCLSIIVLGLIIAIVYVVATWDFKKENSQEENNNPNDTADSGTSFKLAVVIACSIISAILLIIVVVTIREAFFILEISEWKILKPDLTKPQLVFRESINEEQEYTPEERFSSLNNDQEWESQNQNGNSSGFEGEAYGQDQERYNQSDELFSQSEERYSQSPREYSQDSQHHTFTDSRQIKAQENSEQVQSLHVPRSLNDSAMTDDGLLRERRSRKLSQEGQQLLKSAAEKFNSEIFMLRNADGESNNKAQALPYQKPYVLPMNRVVIQNQLFPSSIENRLTPQGNNQISFPTEDWQQSDRNRYARELSERSDALRKEETVDCEEPNQQLQIITYEEFDPNRVELSSSTNNITASKCVAFPDAVISDTNQRKKERPTSSNPPLRLKKHRPHSQSNKVLTQSQSMLFQQIRKEFTRDHDNPSDELIEVKIDVSEDQAKDYASKLSKAIFETKDVQSKLTIKAPSKLKSYLSDTQLFAGKLFRIRSSTTVREKYLKN